MTGVAERPSAPPEVGIDAQANLFNVGIAWGSALFQIMALNPRTPDGVIIAWGRLGGEGGDTVADVGAHAEQTGRDVIYLGFGGELSEGPTNVVVAEVGRRGVTLHQDCEVWYFSSRHGRVELLAADRRFKLDEASHLKGRPNTLDEMRARRVARAQARWRQLATEILEESASDGAPGRLTTTT